MCDKASINLITKHAIFISKTLPIKRCENATIRMDAGDNVAAECLPHLHHTWKVPDTYLGLEMSYPD
jgi:hypothetical protein